MLLLSGLLGALLGASLTFGFNMWKFHRDERNARCDELCKAIWDVGVMASEYWSKKRSSPDQQIIEAKILASQALVDGLYEDFIEYSVQPSGELDQLLSELQDALTGGTFTEEEHEADFARMTRAPQAAGMTIVALRRSYRQSIPFHKLGKAIRENRRRELDLKAPCL